MLQSHCNSGLPNVSQCFLLSCVFHVPLCISLSVCCCPCWRGCSLLPHSPGSHLHSPYSPARNQQSAHLPLISSHQYIYPGSPTTHHQIVVLVIMDSTDKDATSHALDNLCHVLTSQGILVGQHDQILWELVDLSVSVQRIRPQVDVAAHAPASHAIPTFHTHSSPEGEPMQLGWTHMSPAEQLRRMQGGECVYCGQRSISFPPVFVGQKSRLTSNTGGSGKPNLFCLPLKPQTHNAAGDHSLL